MKDLAKIRYSLPSGTKEEFLELRKAICSNISEKELIIKAFKLAFWRRERDSLKVHPSEVSHEFCPRKVYFKMLNLQSDKGFINIPDNNLQRIFDFGTIVHLYFQINLLEQDVLTDWEVEFENRRYKIKGSADGINEDSIFEIKTINPYQFQKLKEPLEPHVKQTSIYAKELGKKQIILIYVDKSSLNIKTFKIQPDFKYLDRLYKELENIRRQIKLNFGLLVPDLNSVLEKPKPERICKSPLSESALNCPYRRICFDSKN